MSFARRRVRVHLFFIILLDLYPAQQDDCFFPGKSPGKKSNFKLNVTTFIPLVIFMFRNKDGGISGCSKKTFGAAERFFDNLYNLVCVRLRLSA
jgi:hypothetical protein